MHWSCRTVRTSFFSSIKLISQGSSEKISGIFRKYLDLTELFEIWDSDLGLIFNFLDLRLGLGTHFLNLGSGIRIWVSLKQNPGSGIPGSQIADPCSPLYWAIFLRIVQNFTFENNFIFFDLSIGQNSIFKSWMFHRDVFLDYQPTQFFKVDFIFCSHPHFSRNIFSDYFLQCRDFFLLEGASAWAQ